MSMLYLVARTHAGKEKSTKPILRGATFIHSLSKSSINGGLLSQNSTVSSWLVFCPLCSYLHIVYYIMLCFEYFWGLHAPTLDTSEHSVTNHHTRAMCAALQARQLPIDFSNIKATPIKVLQYNFCSDKGLWELDIDYMYTHLSHLI